MSRYSQKNKHRVAYTAPTAACAGWALKGRCTPSAQRYVYVHLHDAALERMRQRATAAVMRLRRCIVEHPFGTLKYRIFGHPRFLLRGVAGAQTESSLAIMAYNLKRMVQVLGGRNSRPHWHAEADFALFHAPTSNASPSTA